MKRFIIFILSFYGIIPNVSAQTQNKNYTLEQCIRIAAENSTTISQSNLLVDAERTMYKQSMSSLFPSLNGSIDHGINQGRSIDPFTNNYVNQKFEYANYQFGLNVRIFNGFSIQNNIKRFNYSYQATQMELQQAKDNLSFNVIFAYLQVLGNEDLVEQSKQQLVISQKQLERLEQLNAQGAISPPQVYDIQGQVKDNELTLLNTKNALELSKLALAQILNIPYDPTMKLERDLGTEFIGAIPVPDEIYANAATKLGVVKASGIRMQSARAAMRSAKGELYPSLSLGASINSNYSSAAMQQTNFSNESIPYLKQLNNNTFSSIGINLRIPLFNSLQARTRVNLAAIEFENMKLRDQNIKRQLRQEVEQAYLNISHALKRYQVSLEQVEAYTASFRAAEVRFISGSGNSMDYLMAKTNLDRANTNLIGAKYDYLYRKKVIDFYTANQL